MFPKTFLWGESFAKRPFYYLGIGVRDLVGKGRRKGRGRTEQTDVHCALSDGESIHGLLGIWCSGAVKMYFSLSSRSCEVAGYLKTFWLGELSRTRERATCRQRYGKSNGRGISRLN